ncbi:MAG: YpiB family protein [Firmicutes bacterium]|nr:YpiB family protein [Bacillota bacterium]
MKDLVKPTDKKHFIEWFLNHYELKNPEAEWLLQYLAQNEQILARVHFTDHFRNLPKAMLLSTTCVQMTAFKYYKNKRVTSDVEKAFLDVHNHPEEDLYVTLYFSDRAACPEYSAVLEGVQSQPAVVSTSEVLMALQAELWLGTLERQLQEQDLRVRLDQALDTRDKALFNELSAQWRAFFPD